MAANGKIAEVARKSTGDKKKLVPKAAKLRLVFEIDVVEITSILRMLAAQGVVVNNPHPPRPLMFTVRAEASN